MNMWLQILGIIALFLFVIAIGGALERNHWLDDVLKGTPILIDKKVYHCMEQP